MSMHSMPFATLFAAVAALTGCGEHDTMDDAAAVSADSTFQLVSSTTQDFATDQGRLSRTEMRVQNGPSAQNQFGVVRWYRPDVALRGAVVLAPGVLVSSRYEEIGDDPHDANQDAATSIAGALALANLDVYLYNPRASLLKPGACDAADACGQMKSWGIEARVDDIGYIRDLVAQVHGARRPIIGGLSMGGTTALAAVNRDPGAWAGIIDWDGPLAQTDELQARYADVCTKLTASLAEGALWDTSGFAGTLKALSDARLAGADASSPFIPGLTNGEAFRFSVTSPFPANSPSFGPPLNGFPAGLQMNAGNKDLLTYGSDEKWARMLSNSVMAYFPLHDWVDATCVLAGSSTLAGRLGAFQGPALGFQMGRGFGDSVAAAMALLGSNDRELLVYPDYGHADLLITPDRAVESTILKWIKKHERALGWN
jgi:pimeloyl-ACP methyl ester carboxylesterase